jgi:hypothetical protein
MARETQRVVVRQLRNLAENAPALDVRAEAEAQLRALAKRLQNGDAHGQSVKDDIQRFLGRPYPQAKPTEPSAVPPGPPIGG